MKTTLLIIAAFLLIFIVSQFYISLQRKKIETYPFSVVKTYADFEIRNYEASLFTSVKLPTNNYNDASSKGFSVLAGYIFGKNEENKKIAMTSPVAMSLEEEMTMFFMIPKKYNKQNVPKPTSKLIEFKEMPQKKVAVLRFGGWANTAKIERKKQELIALLKSENIAHATVFYVLGYNPPFDVFFRRNEISVEVLSI